MNEFFTKGKGRKMEELDLKELFSMFWNKKAEIILITLILIVIGIIYSYFYTTPMYTAKTNMVLVQSSGTISQTGDSTITSTDLTMNAKLVSTYSEIVKKNVILGQVASNLNISDEKIEDLKNNISVKALSDTEIIEITVKDVDPNFTTEVANEIAKVFSEKIVEIYNISNIYLLDRAETPTAPSNINHIKDITIFAFIGLVISAVYVLIGNMLDNTIKTEEDIEKLTGLVVLTAIPDYETELRNIKGGKR